MQGFRGLNKAAALTEVLGGGAYLGCLINHIHFSEEIHRKKCVNGAVGHMQMGLFPLRPEVISLQSYIDNRRFPL